MSRIIPFDTNSSGNSMTQGFEVWEECSRHGKYLSHPDGCPQCEVEQEERNERLERELSDSELIFGAGFNPGKVMKAVDEEPEEEFEVVDEQYIAELQLTQ